MSYNTIPELFLESVNKLPDHYAYYEKLEGEWVGLTYSQVGETVEDLARGLSKLGIQPEDKVAILSNNNPKWAMCDYAVACVGAVTVTVYPTLTPAQIRYILEDSETRLVFTENEEQTDKILEFMEECPHIESIIVMNDQTGDNEHVSAFSSLIQKDTAGDSENDFDFKKRALSVKPEDILTLIYTSGTTGNPKGVMLTHNNLVSNIVNGRKAIKIDETDVFLSFLPLSHSFERMVGHFTAFSGNGTVYYAESIEKVSENMGEVRPTVMTSVPRLYEKMYAKVLDKVSNDPALRQKIFWWAIGVGRKAAVFLQRNQKPSGWLGWKYGLANKLVFSKIKERVGGRLRFFVSGGAPLSKEIGEFFSAAGIIILEGYGLTETSPVITCNLEEFYKFGTVGVPIEGVEVRIAEDGEILCRGDNVMKGYYNNPEKTRDAIDDDGWFHTGDIGMFDEDNYLCITDRKKNLIVTSGGKNVAPAPLESALVTSKFVEQCLVIGDRRNFVSALVVPSFESLNEWAQEKGLSTDDRQSLIDDPAVRDLYDDIMVQAMESFSRYEQVKKIELLPNDWTIESDELTPSLKVKRKVVESNYADLIERIYST